jgi:transposase
MFGQKDLESQGSFWTVKSEIVTGPGSAYYDRLDRSLIEAGFDRVVREMCQPYYSEDESKGGRIGIDPLVYFKMLLVGFFENIGSERAIATRCADSISIRGFLKYELTEHTPDHSSLSRIRKRLGTEVYERAFALILEVLHKNKLLKGKRVGIDTSVIEANASMRTLVNNHTGETYDQYLKRLAEEEGIDSEDKQAVRQFDRKRKGKKMSNDDWHSPNDPEAKIGPTKPGKIKMVHKIENVVDLESGAIIQVTTLPGHQADDHDMANHLEQAQEQINTVLQNELNQTTIEEVTGDKGYFNIAELGKLQGKGIRTVIDEKNSNRNLNKLSTEDQKTVKNARRSVRTKYGRSIKKRRGEFLERSFAHLLDNGDLRRTTLSGWKDIQKRNLIGAMGCNLSLLMRKIYGFGTPKQAIAAFSFLRAKLFNWIQLYKIRITGSAIQNRSSSVVITLLHVFSIEFNVLKLQTT